MANLSPSTEGLPSMDWETYSEAGFAFEGNDLSTPAKRLKKGFSFRPTYKVVNKGGLGAVGSPAYSEHPSTDILCLSYDMKDGRGGRLWYPGQPIPGDLCAYVAKGGLVRAWHSFFEYLIWVNVAAPKYGFPAPVGPDQFICTMVEAMAYNLPGGLDKAAKVLGTTGKLPEGSDLVKRLSQPHTPTKTRRHHRRRDDLPALYGYCIQDVAAEDGISQRIPLLGAAEYRLFKTDRRVNIRGVAVDTFSLDASLQVLAQSETLFTSELQNITGGRVGTVAEIDNLKTWLNEQGLAIPDITKPTVEKFIPLAQGPAKRVLEIRQVLGSANVKKLRTLQQQISKNGRLQCQYRMNAADTGRYGSSGVQLQNLSGKGPKCSKCGQCGKIFQKDVEACPQCGNWLDIEEYKDWDTAAVESCLSDIHTKNVHNVIRAWGDPIDALTGVLRGLFIPAPGKKFICVDYNAIEAVCAAILTGCQWRIDVFRTHGKIYEASAAKASGIPLEEILEHKKRTGRHHPLRGTIGKVRELAGGYGGWVNAWLNFGAGEYFADEQAIKEDVLKWRAESPEFPEMWGGQFRWVGPGKWDYTPELHGLEGCAIQAIYSPGYTFSYRDISYCVNPHTKALECRLPSGRIMYYHNARLTPAVDKLNRGPCVQILFDTYNTNPQKGPAGQWITVSTYGGRLFENVVQGVAYDIQAHGMCNAEEGGYPVVMHTHDEVNTETPDSPLYTVSGLVGHLTNLPDWAKHYPIRADGWEDYRYQKD